MSPSIFLDFFLDIIVILVSKNQAIYPDLVNLLILYISDSYDGGNLQIGPM
jgi:hypothetical protein